MQALTLSDLSTMLGFPAEPHLDKDKIGLEALRWRRLNQRERDSALLKIWRQVHDETLTVASPAGLVRWERGWTEVLDRVSTEGCNEETLRPQYFQYDIIRLLGDFALVEKTDFEFRLYRILADQLFRRYLTDVDGILELACGTGLNMLHLGKLFPGIKLLGCDWAKPSQAILARIAQEHRLDLTAQRVDLWTGDGFDPFPLRHAKRKAIISMHGLEQIGGNINPYLDITLRFQPSIVFHIEPLVELYQCDYLFDEVAARYHKKRGYLEGLLPAIRKLRDEGRVEIIAERRLGFGSMFHEGYSLLVWRPILR